MPTAPARPAILVISPDPDFLKSARDALEGADGFEPVFVTARPEAADPDFRRAQPVCLVVDVGAGDGDALHGLRALMRRAGESVPVLVVADGFDADLTRALLRLKAADLVVKPASAGDILRGVRRLAGDRPEEEVSDAEIFAFMPATGGAGNTTLAVQTAVLLNEAAARRRQTTCIVDLNLQHGCCAEYLDLEPRFDLSEIEARPDRLDRQLLEVMLSRHKSGLAVVSAPPCPWEMRSFRPDLVTRLLDLVSTFFDHVVIDLPRTWFPWTDSVLQGSDRVFLVTEMTVPALRHTQRLARGVEERIGKPGRLGVIVNRTDGRPAPGGVSEKDVIELFGPLYAGRVANNYKVVREALDRGVPVRELMPACDVLKDLGRIVLGEEAGAARRRRLLPALPFFGRRTPAPAMR